MNIQRNIFAGLLIFLVFLTIPIYLDFIGINEAAVNKNIDKTLPEKTTPQQTIIPNYSNPEPGALNGILDQIIVSTDYYRMILSKSSGGSISFYPSLLNTCYFLLRLFLFGWRCDKKPIEN